MLFEVGFGALGDWTTYTNMNEINEVLLEGDQLWCATTGGLAVLDINSRTFTKLTNVDGLGGNNLYSTTSDSAGCFWFGAKNGTLTRLSPEENFWKVYNLIDRDGRRLRIKDLLADGDQLWIGTDVGLSLFLIYKHGGEIKETYRRLGEHVQGGEEATSIHLLGDRIWVGMLGGVATASKTDPNLLDPLRWTSFTTESSPALGNDSVYAIADMEGEIVIGTREGVYGFDHSDSTWQPRGLQNRIVNDLEYLDGKLYAASNAGIYVYEDQVWSQLPTSGLLSSYFNSIAIHQDGTVWVGTAGKGVSAYDGYEWKNYPIAGPPANLFLDMDTDNEGNLWCAQERYGASFFDGAEWVSLSSVPEIPRHQIRAVERDKQDNLWFSTWGGGVVKFDGDQTWTGYDEENSPLKSALVEISYVVVNDVAVDETGNRWFPDWGAVDSTRLVCSPAHQETAWVVFHENDGIKSLYMDRIFAKDGHLYICSRNVGLVDYNYNRTLQNREDDQVTTYNSTDHRLSDDAVLCASVDKDAILWVGTSAGLDKFDPDFDRFRSVPLPAALGLQVNDIAVDERNNKWIATSSGLGMMNAKGEFVRAFTTFNSRICANNVLRLKIDERTGDVWIGTDNGLSRYESGIGAPAEHLSQVVPFPNPLVIREGTEVFTFDKLPYEAKVTILTVAGETVREIRAGDKWDGRNEGGELVASGIYLFHVQVPSGESTVGKIAVIRE